MGSHFRDEPMPVKKTGLFRGLLTGTVVGLGVILMAIGAGMPLPAAISLTGGPLKDAPVGDVFDNTVNTTSLADPAALKAGIAGYKQYLNAQTTLLATGTDVLAAAIHNNDVPAAQAAYLAARQPYERIWPVAHTFQDLDRAIDAPGTGVNGSSRGFHRIEKQLFQANSTAGMAIVADQLDADVKSLQQKLVTADPNADQIAEGSVAILNQAGRFDMYGEEERYARTDLADAAADVDGSKAGFDALRLAFDTQPETVTRVATIDARYGDAARTFAAYKVGTGYTTFDKLSPDDIKKLTQAIDALAEPLSSLPAEVAH